MPKIYVHKFLAWREEISFRNFIECPQKESNLQSQPSEGCTLSIKRWGLIVFLLYPNSKKEKSPEKCKLSGLFLLFDALRNYVFSGLPLTTTKRITCPGSITLTDRTGVRWPSCCRTTFPAVFSSFSANFFLLISIILS